MIIVNTTNYISKRFLRKCEEFVICGSKGDGYDDGLFTDGYPHNDAIYHIIIEGTVQMGKAFESDYIILDTAI